MKAFKVWLGRKHIDTVFYSDGINIDKEEVKRSLINHDGYDPSIKVTQERKRKQPTTEVEA